MSDVPQARDLLAKALAVPGLPPAAGALIEGALDHMYRRAYAKPKAASRLHCSASMAKDIRAYASAFPGQSQVEIAAFFGTNPGRVSEALHYLR